MYCCFFCKVVFREVQVESPAPLLLGLALDGPYPFSLCAVEPFAALVQKLKSASTLSAS